MKLADILKGIEYKSYNYHDCEIEHITFDSRNVTNHSIFVAQRGVHVDGHKYIDTAIKQGATTIICEELPTNINNNVIYIVTPNSSHTLGLMAANFYNHPSEKLKLVGKNGTSRQNPV